MHPAVQGLADRYGIKLSSRVCGGFDLNQPCWNGEDLATRWLDVTGYIWSEPTACAAVPMSDHDILHEIGHWVAAAPEQRDLPEYGLGALVFSTFHFADKCPEVVDEDEGRTQEFLTWLLCIYWGKKYNLSPVSSEELNVPIYVSWDAYTGYKFLMGLKNEVLFWTALIRFRRWVDENES